MNALIEQKYISEMACGTNFSYILSDNSAFLSTEYKVLQSQGDNCFVKCMKMLYNGKMQIYYLTRAMKPFSAMLSGLDADSFLTIVSNLLSNIIDVKHNGFLACQNIDISFDKIFVDPATYKVSLVYLPLNRKVFDDYSIFENELRTGLIKVISSYPMLESQKTLQLSSALSDGTLSLEDLQNRIKGGKLIGEKPVKHEFEQPVAEQTLRIIAMNAPERIEIMVTKDDFVIGKKPELADGVVSFNPMISRSHCKIQKRGGVFTIMDLQSANGTFVNKERLHPNQPCQINNGDIIRLANSDFQVSIV